MMQRLPIINLRHDLFSLSKCRRCHLETRIDTSTLAACTTGLRKAARRRLYHNYCLAL